MQSVACFIHECYGAMPQRQKRWRSSMEDPGLEGTKGFKKGEVHSVNTSSQEADGQGDEEKPEYQMRG